MFNQIFNLFKRNTNKTPLEDYTTELFVGTLNNDINLKHKFCKDFLGLKSNTFRINTQVYYPLDDKQNCIVDVVIKGENELCFIENKVNSKEGFIQLERYSEVLDKYHKDGFTTKLTYCTKKSEPKEITKHSFVQFKWHDVSEFFKKNSKEQITKLFIEFLNQNDMSTDMTIKGIHISTLENAANIFRVIDKNIDNVTEVFSDKFGDLKDLRKNSQFKTQIYDHERICVMATPINKSRGESEILYGFEFKGNLISQIYLDKGNEFHDRFVQEIKKQSTLKCDVFDWGSVIYIDKNLGEFLNDEDSENKIEEWFLDSFTILEKFMVDTKDVIEWRV